MAREVTLLIGRDEGLFSLTSKNGGLDWSPSEIQLPDIEVHAIKAAPDGTVYLGTRGHGLFRSKSGMHEWEAIETPAAAPRIRSIVPDGDRLIIGTEAGLGEGASPVGVFAWSQKSGWEPLGDLRTCSGSREWFYPVPTEGVHARWVSVDPRRQERVYAAIQVGGIAITDDNGETWTDRRDLDSLDVHMVEPHPPGRGSFTLAPVEGLQVFIGATTSGTPGKSWPRTAGVSWSNSPSTRLILIASIWAPPAGTLRSGQSRRPAVGEAKSSAQTMPATRGASLAEASPR